MNPIWIVVGLGVFGALGAIARWRGRDRHTDLGFVSHQWVAEHRLHDPPR